MHEKISHLEENKPRLQQVAPPPVALWTRAPQPKDRGQRTKVNSVSSFTQCVCSKVLTVRHVYQISSNVYREKATSSNCLHAERRIRRGLPLVSNRYNGLR